MRGVILGGVPCSVINLRDAGGPPPMRKDADVERSTRQRWRTGASSRRLDEIVREGARRIGQALRAEVAAVIEALSDQVDERGHRLVRRTTSRPSSERSTPCRTRTTAPRPCRRPGRTRAWPRSSKRGTWSISADSEIADHRQGSP